MIQAERALLTPLLFVRAVETAPDVESAAAAAFRPSGPQITIQLTGRPIRRVVVSDADYRAGLLARGLPEPAADMLVGMFAASRQGQFAPPDPRWPASSAGPRRPWRTS